MRVCVHACVHACRRMPCICMHLRMSIIHKINRNTVHPTFEASAYTEYTLVYHVTHPRTHTRPHASMQAHRQTSTCGFKCVRGRQAQHPPASMLAMCLSNSTTCAAFISPPPTAPPGRSPVACPAASFRWRPPARRRARFANASPSDSAWRPGTWRGRGGHAQCHNGGTLERKGDEECAGAGGEAVPGLPLSEPRHLYKCGEMCSFNMISLSRTAPGKIAAGWGDGAKISKSIVLEAS